MNIFQFIINMSYPTFTPPVFDIDQSTEFTQHLQTEGFVVIRNILNSQEKDTFFQKFKTDFNHVSPNFKFDDKSTWNIKTYPGMYGKGMCVFNGFGQADFMWYLRTNTTIQNTFKKIYNEDELVTSMDGFSVFLDKNQKSKSWHHIDQNPKNPITSYQASYNYYPVNSEDAGFVVAPKSHIEYKPEVKHKRDWIMVEKDSEWNNKVVKLIIPENCLTFWNSKLIHANAGMNENTERINRLTCYLTYLPKSQRSEKIKKERLQAYTNGETCSHWANQCKIKKYPFGFRKNYEKKNLGKINPLLIDENIPQDRLKLI